MGPGDATAHLTQALCENGTCVKTWQIGKTYPKDDSKYPVGIGYSPEHEKPIFFGEGSGWSYNAGNFSAKEALSPTWEKHIKDAGATWFLPFIEVMAKGAKPSLEEIEAAYRKEHRAPICLQLVT